MDGGELTVIKRKGKSTSFGRTLIMSCFVAWIEATKACNNDTSHPTREGANIPPVTIITAMKRNKPPILPCGSSKTLMTGDEYFIQSPDFKKMKYPNNAHCDWEFAANNCQMGMSCPDFSLTDFLCFDHLDIVDHNGSMVRYCGKNGPIERILSDNVTISFRSSAWFPDIGFRCRIVCKQTVAEEESPFPKPEGEPVKCHCGKGDQRIVGGKAAHFPWQAGLVRKGGSSPFCGGSLINSRYVLTVPNEPYLFLPDSAAHCVQGRTPYNLEIIFHVSGVGDNGGHQMEVRRVVENIIVHKKFTSRLDYDAALVRLGEPVDISGFSGAAIIPICLPTEKDMEKTYIGENATVSGWGLTSEDGEVSSTLLQTDVEIISNERCAEFYPTITKRMLCAHTPGQDACQGDSGGPLVISEGNPGEGIQALENSDMHIRFVQIGIVSWGQGCAVKPGVYVRITEILNWLAVNAIDGSYCSNQ